MLSISEASILISLSSILNSLSSTFNLTSSTFNLTSSTFNTKLLSASIALEASRVTEPPFKDWELNSCFAADGTSPPSSNFTSPPFANALGNITSPAWANTLPVFPTTPPLCIIGGELLPSIALKNGALYKPVDIYPPSAYENLALSFSNGFLTCSTSCLLVNGVLSFSNSSLDFFFLALLLRPAPFSNQSISSSSLVLPYAPFILASSGDISTPTVPIGLKLLAAGNSELSLFLIFSSSSSGKFLLYKL